MPPPSWKRVFGFTAVSVLVALTLLFLGVSNAAAAIVIAIYFAGVVVIEAILQRNERRFRR